LWQIYCRHVYDVRPGDRTIVDAGANIGLFTCYAATVAPDAMLHAIEPLPSTHARLVGSVQQNGFARRVRCYEYALSSCAGEQVMSTSVIASQMAYLGGPSGAPGTVRVTAITLTELLNMIGAPEIDLLKMDIEGSEYDVLLSTTSEVLRRCRRIVVEFHKPSRPAVHNKHALARHLAGAGFRVSESSDAAGDYGIFRCEQSPLRVPPSHAI
jgi:FkbM family methyltransferase